MENKEDSMEIYYGLKDYLKDKRAGPTMSALTLTMGEVVYIMMKEEKDDIPKEASLDKMINIIKDQIKSSYKTIEDYKNGRAS